MDGLPPVLLLDLDDTLVSFHKGAKGDAWLHAHAHHQHELAVDAETFVEAIGVVARPYWADAARAHRGRMDLVRARREIVRAALARVGLRDTALADRVADHYTHQKERDVAPFEGAIDTLRRLRARGVRLGLVTNGSSAFQRRKLARYQLEGFFDAIVVEGEWGRGKPDSSIFLEALRRLNATAEQTWMVGDNLSADIAGAQALGMLGVWNDPQRGGLPADAPTIPDRIIHHVAELLG